MRNPSLKYLNLSLEELKETLKKEILKAMMLLCKQNQ